MEDQYPAGVTLIELLLTFAVLGIALALAIPAMAQFIEGNRLVSAAKHLAADLHFARSAAIKSSRYGAVHVNFRTAGSDWCYGLSHQAACDCFAQQTPGKSRCVLRSRVSDEFPGITLTSARFSGRSNTWFEGTRGTARAGHIEFRTASGKALKINVSMLGRIRVCKPATAKMPVGYAPC